MTPSGRQSAGRITRPKRRTQEQRDLAKYATVWDCPLHRTTAHSVRSLQAMAQLEGR